MKTTGALLVLLGMLLAVFGLSMDTTVQTAPLEAVPGMLSRVHNMGLMAQRQLLLEAAQHFSLLGVLLYGLGRVVQAIQRLEVTAERRAVELADVVRRVSPKKDN